MRIAVGGTRLFFDVEGTKLEPDGAAMREKPALLCLHGGPGLDHSAFRPSFAPLAQIAQLIYLDQRGHGRSERSDPAHWSLERWAEDVREFCEALGIEFPIVLGTSFGGYVAMAYAIRYPKHPRALILMSTSARGTGNPPRRQNVLRAFERRGGVEARDAVQRVFDERTPEAYTAFGRICGPLYNRQPPEPDVPKRTVRNHDILPYFERPGGEGVIFDLTRELDRIECPMLVMGGGLDPMTPLEEQEWIVNSVKPGLAQLLRFPDCGHGILRDDSAGVVKAISDFIAQLGIRGTHVPL
jgi:pimeloyl-ACP methyl ester carboxylesterase